MMTMTIGLIVAVVLAVAHAMTSFDLALLSIFLVPVGLATPPWPYQQPQSLSWNAVYPIQQESCQLYHPTAVVAVVVVDDFLVDVVFVDDSHVVQEALREETRELQRYSRHRHRLQQCCL